MKKETTNIIIKNNTIDFSSLTLKQKLAQMVVIRGDKRENMALTGLNIGGVFLDKGKPEAEYFNIISDYQDSSKIKLFVSTDLEGAWNPFKDFKEFAKFSEIKNESEAYDVGLEHGRLMKQIGFNINFAPVAEFSDEIYGGRVFQGTKEEIEDKLESYINGLQESVSGTCKHYPGKGMIKNTHVRRDFQEISRDDLELFEVCFKNNISAVMIGHQVVIGEINSGKRPASVSKEIIESVPEEILVISDEVNMLGLKSFYLFSKADMYRDLINSGENLILDFRLNSKSTYKLLNKLEKMVVKGEINEKRVDESVKKILRKKGYKIK